MDKDFNDYDYDDSTKEIEEIGMNKFDREKYENVDDNIDRELEDNLLENPERNETSFTDPTYEDYDLGTSVNEESIPEVNREIFIRNVKRAETSDKKDFLLKFLERKILKEDGPFSKKLVEGIKIRIGAKGQILGAEFEGKRIVVLKNGKLAYSEDKNFDEAINNFKEISRKATNEHNLLIDSQVEERIESQGGVDLKDMCSDNLESITSEVKVSTRIEINDRIEDLEQEIEENKDIFTSDEIREMRGVIDPGGELPIDKINALNIERDYYKDKTKKEYRLSEREGISEEEKLRHIKRAKYFNFIERVSELKIDEIKLRLNQRLGSQESIEILEEELYKNDNYKFEKFKKWAKNNLIGLSGIAIAIGGIITTVVMNARSAVKKGAQATSNLAKTLAKIGKEVGPIASGVFNIISGIVKMGAKGISFLAQNLWILALALTWFVYD